MRKVKVICPYFIRHNGTCIICRRGTDKDRFSDLKTEGALRGHMNNYCNGRYTDCGKYKEIRGEEFKGECSARNKGSCQVTLS